MNKLKHCVFMEFKPEIGRSQQTILFNKFAALQANIEGFLNIEFGNNIDLENKSNCNAGFIIDFENQTSLNRYTQHHEHKRLGAELVSICVGGVEGIIVFDLIL